MLAQRPTAGPGLDWLRLPRWLGYTQTVGQNIDRRAILQAPASFVVRFLGGRPPLGAAS